jgi:glycosyltransferase involved in cell wall biosynthesis
LLKTNVKLTEWYYERMMEGLSVIIPAYNAANWLEHTTKHLEVAIRTSGIKKAEIIIINDGSSDDTSIAAKNIKTSISIVVKDQKNAGRYMARKAGIKLAKYSFILLLDARVFIHKNSLGFVLKQIEKHPDRIIWNGHVYVDKKGNIIAKFGDAITYIGWRRYFSNPKTCSYGIEDFDHYPKGAGCFLVPKKLLVEAMSTFEEQTYDIKNSSDDTHLIRLLAAENRINLSPNFSCTYHARTKLRQFIQHSFNRGKFFVDGFFRPGNRFYVPLIFFLILSLALVITFLLLSTTRLPILVGLFAVWILELLGAIIFRVEPKDAFSLFLLTPIFTAAYGLGIWSAVLKKILSLLSS